MKQLIILIFVFSYMLSAKWTKQTSFTSEKINDVYVEKVSGNLYAVGDNAKVYKSTNSGTDWNDISSTLTTANLNKIFFTSKDVGVFLTQDGKIYRTIDQGANFHLLFTFNSTISFNDIYELDKKNWIVIGDGGKYIYSTNGGSNWKDSSNFDTKNLNSICFNGIHNGAIVADGGSVFYTTNGGNDWTSKTITGVSENLNSISSFGTNNVMVAVGNGGRIIRSADNGKNWQIISSGVTENLNRVLFTSDPNVAFIVGDAGVILRTSDGGSSWTQQVNSDSNNLYSVAFSNSSVGYAMGNNGTYLTTISGGLDKSLNLTNPVGGSTYIINTNMNITWTQTNLNKINIEVSRDYKNSWDKIASNVPASNLSYSWKVLSPSSDLTFIRISDAENSLLNSVSGQIRLTDFLLNITSPVQNEEININSTKKITWTSTNVDKVNIYYSLDNGSNWSLIRNNVTASDGAYMWDVPSTPSNQAKIKIENSSNPSQYVESNVFTILGDNLILLNPNNGNFDAGDQVVISWESQNVQNISINYTMNGGVTWENISSSYSAINKNYTWTVPYKPGQGKIRIKSLENPNLYDISSESFNINGYNLTIINPTNATYKSNSPLAISWSADYRIDKLKIEFSTDGGSNWSLIANNVSASSGTYNWTTPNQSGDNFKIKLTDNTGNIVKISNTFSISQIKLTAPNQLSVLKAESNESIKWTANGVSQVNLLYSTNEGSSWINIISNVDNPTYTEYLWNVPNINSNIKLRIENSIDQSQYDEIELQIQEANISITKPEANSYLLSGNKTEIKWTSNLVNNVNIYYKVDGGSYISLSNNYLASKGSYTWTLPAIESENIVVKVEDTSNNQIFGESEVFGITDDVITLINPNGNEIWNQGSEYTINWEASDANSIKIELSTDNGSSWSEIESSVNALIPYKWNVGNTPSTQALIKVSDANKTIISDKSDKSFRINGLKLNSQLNGEVYLYNSNAQISWTAVGVSKVNIYYSSDSGNNWNIITQNYPATSGFYNWKIPDISGNHFRIKIIDPTKSNFEDFSKVDFKVSGLKIISPVAGDKLLFGTKQYINFEQETNENVKIEHSTDNGATWYTVVSNTDGSSGSYLWDVPEMAGENNLLKITKINSPNIFGVTNGVFSIKEQGVMVTYPNAGETLTANTSNTITWAAANLDKVKIEYSLNNGTNWNLIVASIDASLRSYVWTTPDSNSNVCLIRISDTKIPEINDIVDMNFKIAGGSNYLPDDWDFTKWTGRASQIIFPTTANMKIGENAIQNGDVIGAFYDNGTSLKCAGYIVWNGTNSALAVWGNNSLTTQKDGYDNNETYYIRVWSKSSGLIYDATINYSQGNSYYTDNGISIVSSLETQRTLNIPLESGRWQIISSNLKPINSKVSEIFENNFDDFEYIVSQDAAIYSPSQGIDNIVNWQIKEGYQIYSKNNDTLKFKGNSVIPSSYLFNFNANRWYIMSYLPKEDRAIANEFSNLSSLIMVKNDEGQVYYPAFGINSINTMRVGEGYQIAVSQNSQTFAYTNVPTGGGLPPVVNIDENVETYYQTDIFKTGNSAVIVLNNTNNLYGEIGVFDGKGRLVGHNVVNGIYVPITVWGDNSVSNEKDGATEDEELTLEYYDYESKSIQKIVINQVFELMSGTDMGNVIKYKRDAIFNIEVSKDLTGVDDKETKSSIYPNPTKESIYVNLDGNGVYNLEVYDLSGVKVISKELNSYGKTTLTLNVTELNTGSYILKIIGSRSIETHKFIKIE